MDQTNTTVAALVQAAADGDANAPGQIFPLVYKELRRLARNYMRRERLGHSLQPTALVHEAYLRLFNGHDQSAISRTHFFRLSARAMREVLVEHARGRIRLKRGGGIQLVALSNNLIGEPLQEKAVLQLNDFLAELEKVAPRAAEVVEMRFFAGMTEEEIARGLGISGSTVKREWTFARAWLNVRLSK